MNNPILDKFSQLYKLVDSLDSVDGEYSANEPITRGELRGIMLNVESILEDVVTEIVSEISSR